MTRFVWEEYLRRYFKIELLNADELEQIVKIVGKNKKVQALIERDTEMLKAVISTLFIPKENKNG